MFTKKPLFDNWMMVFAERSRFSVIITTIPGISFHINKDFWRFQSYPIHVNPYFSDFASLPNTIVHGMWTSAAIRRYVATQGHPDRVLALVFPGDRRARAYCHGRW